MEAKDEFLTIKETAAFLKVTRQTVRRYQKDGYLPEFRSPRKGFMKSQLLSVMYGAGKDHEPKTIVATKKDPGEHGE